jgi:glycosyltransferase involved in cell wall biosynthesis
MRILIVSVLFPPQNSIASLRPYSWAKYWAREGHEVTVLTVPKFQEAWNLALSTDGFAVREVPLPWHGVLWRMLGAGGRTGAGASPEPAGFGMLAWRLRDALRGMMRPLVDRTGMLVGCRFPDLADLWVGRAFRCVRREHWDLVVSTAGPYPVHRVAARLRHAGMAARWVADWRDLWVDNHMHPGFAAFRPFERWWERRLMRRADVITTVSEPLARTLRAKYGPKVHVVTNGVDPEDLEQLPRTPAFPRDGVLRILYTGTFYPGRQDPSPLFDAIRQLRDSGRLRAGQLEVLFCGHNTEVALHLAESSGVGEFVRHLGFLPRDTVLHMQQWADALLFLEYEENAAEGILTGKIFEYVAQPTFVLSIGRGSRSGVDELLLESQHGVALGSDRARIRAVLSDWLTAGAPDVPAVPEAFLAAHSRRRQAHVLLAAAGVASGSID